MAVAVEDWVRDGTRGVPLPTLGEGVERGWEGVPVGDTLLVPLPRVELVEVKVPRATLPVLHALPLELPDPHRGGEGVGVAPLPVGVPPPAPPLPALTVARRVMDGVGAEGAEGPGGGVREVVGVGTHTLPVGLRDRDPVPLPDTVGCLDGAWVVEGEREGLRDTTPLLLLTEDAV